MSTDVPFPRPLKLGDYGSDVEGVGRALCKAGLYVPLAVFNRAPERWRRTFGQRKVDAVNRLRKLEGWKPTGVYNEACKWVLQDGGYFDARAIWLIEKYHAPVPPPSDRFRAALSDFCLRAERSEARWHYTRARPYRGLGSAPEFVHYNDCSSYAILAYYWARKESGLKAPDPSGYNYSGWGNTWDDLDSHPRVRTGLYTTGDLAHYEGHVTVCRRPGNSASAVFSSFGSERGPIPTNLNYRDDLLFVVRPPLS